MNSWYRTFEEKFLNPCSAFLRRRGFFLDILLGLIIGEESLRRLLAFPDPPGMNGYFYLKQTKTLATNFSFYFGDHSLAFAPLVLLRWLTNSDLHAFQLGIALSLAAAGWAITFFVNQLSLQPLEKLCVKVLTICALFSSSFFAEFSLNFYKNLVAGVLIIWCAGFLLGNRKRASLFFFVLAFLTHKSVALLGALYFGIYLGGELLTNFRAKAGARKTILLLLGSFAVAVLFSLFFLAHFPKSQAFLAFAENSFSTPEARWKWWRELSVKSPHRAMEAASWVLLLACLGFGWRRIERKSARLCLVAGILFFLAAHPFQPSASSALGYRLLLLCSLLLPPLTAVSYSSLRGGTRYLPVAAMALASLAFFSPFSFSMEAIRKEMRPYSALRPEVEKIPLFVRREDHLISHHGMEFFVDYVTDIRSRSFLPDPSFTGKQFRLVYMAPKWLDNSPVADDIEQRKLMSVGTSYFLLLEDDWQSLRAAGEFPASWRNPTHQRPAHVYE